MVVRAATVTQKVTGDQVCSRISAQKDLTSSLPFYVTGRRPAQKPQPRGSFVLPAAMPFRWTHIRTVEPSIPHDRTVHQPFSLWWAALAAADETMQGGPLVPAWLRLFSTHLSSADNVRLRWGGDLGESAELRRAYSALYGRYFSRALLASRLGFTDFVPLRTNVTRLPNGVTIRRTAKGDIPDWIAWDPATGSYCLCEAKGSLTGKEPAFMTGQPTCVTEGKKQFGRVEVLDRSGRAVATRNWVAANLWSTDSRRGESVSLLWDPPSDGGTFSEGESEKHADGIRRRRIANIALRLGRARPCSLLIKVTKNVVICGDGPSIASSSRAATFFASSRLNSGSIANETAHFLGRPSGMRLPSAEFKKRSAAASSARAATSSPHSDTSSTSAMSASSSTAARVPPERLSRST